MRQFFLLAALPQMDIFDLLNAVLWRLLAVALAVLVVGLAVKSIYSRATGPKGKPTIKSRKKATGVIFGKHGLGLACSPENAEGHVVVFGGTGLGKTSALLVPTLRKWNGTAFVIDISGDISRNVETPGKLVYEPGNPQTTPYNVFAAVDAARGIEDKNELLTELAFLIMPPEIHEHATTKYFNDEGRKMLTGALLCYYHMGLDFVQICEKIIESDFLALLSEVKEKGGAAAYRYIASFQGTNPQNAAGCKQSLDAAVTLFATNEKIKKGLRRPHSSEQGISPAELEQSSVFVVLEESKLNVLAPLLHILTAQTLSYMSTRPNNAAPTILLALDEFPALGKLEILHALRTLRKKNIRIMVFVQSLADLDLIYGEKERQAMLNNYRYKVILGCGDPDTQEHVSRMIGEKTVTRRSVSHNDRTTTQTESEYKERIIPPAELDRLGNRLILLSPGGFLKLRKNFYFKNPA